MLCVVICASLLSLCCVVDCFCLHVVWCLSLLIWYLKRVSSLSLVVCCCHLLSLRGWYLLFAVCCLMCVMCGVRCLLLVVCCVLLFVVRRVSLAVV